MEEILQKYYHYSNNQDVLKFVKPKAKLGGLLWFVNFWKLHQNYMIIID